MENATRRVMLERFASQNARFQKQAEQSLRRIHGRSIQHLAQCDACSATAAAWARRRDGRTVRRPGRTRSQIQADLKALVLGRYSGGTPECACCGTRHLPSLTLDHVDQAGAAHRRAAKIKGSLYNWVKRLGFPSGFRVLCWTCNMVAFRMGGECDCSAARLRHVAWV